MNDLAEVNHADTADKHQDFLAFWFFGWRAFKGFDWFRRRSNLIFMLGVVEIVLVLIHKERMINF